MLDSIPMTAEHLGCRKHEDKEVSVRATAVCLRHLPFKKYFLNIQINKKKNEWIKPHKTWPKTSKCLNMYWDFFPFFKTLWKSKMPALFQDILGDMFLPILIVITVWEVDSYSKVRWLDRWTGYFPRVSSQLFIVLCNFDLNWWSEMSNILLSQCNHQHKPLSTQTYGLSVLSLFGYLYISFLSEKLRPKIISEWVWEKKCAQKVSVISWNILNTIF